MATYHPPNQSDQYFFDKIGNALDRYATQYEKFLLSGDFNVQDSQHCIKNFLYEYNLTNQVKDKTCFKNSNSPTCIDLF